MANIEIREGQTVTASIQMFDQIGNQMGVCSETFTITVLPSGEQTFSIVVSEEKKEEINEQRRIVRLED